MYLSLSFGVEPNAIIKESVGLHTKPRHVPACSQLSSPIDPLRFLCCYSGEEKMDGDGDRTDVQLAVAVAVELSLVALSSTK